jgi:hypothetical protein
MASETSESGIRDDGPGLRRLAGGLVQVSAVFHVPSITPPSDGPWTREAEKVAWSEGDFGFIIRRSAHGGHLGGFVGVGPAHPLHGFLAPALRAAGIRAHGGVNYAAACQKKENEDISRTVFESRSICHVTVRKIVTRIDTTQERTLVEIEPHEDMWWIGFECNQPTDLIPNPSTRHPAAPAGTAERVYRDEHYVFIQCTWLALQLAAVARNEDPRAVPAPSIPAIGFDPGKAF